MKKRCTNNKCRKFITVTAEVNQCPHCGKKYPRLQEIHKEELTSDESYNMPNFIASLSNLSTESLKLLMSIAGRTNRDKGPKGVLISEFEGVNKISLIKTVRKWTGRGLRESKDLVESVPFIIEAKEISFNYLNSTMDELNGKWSIPAESPMEGLARELDEIGCLYKIIK